MRDPIRELDLERAIDVRGGVCVDVADDGTATITLHPGHLDRLLAAVTRHDYYANSSEVHC